MLVGAPRRHPPVLLPEGNRRDWEDVPEEVRAALEVAFTSDVHVNVAEALLSVVVPDAARLRAALPRRDGPSAPPPR